VPRVPIRASRTAAVYIRLGRVQTLGVGQVYLSALTAAGRPLFAGTRCYGNSSKSRDTILDPFAGSGTTLIACEKVGQLLSLFRRRLRMIDYHYRHRQFPLLQLEPKLSLQRLRERQFARGR
jgi:hypothetical protein